MCCIETLLEAVAVVRQIYRHFDMELAGETETAMLHFLAENPQNIHGVHRYSLGELDWIATQRCAVSSSTPIFSGSSLNRDIVTS